MPCVVVPLVGTWIEIIFDLLDDTSCLVVPLVGTWIEISNSIHLSYLSWSFLSWERGLKWLKVLRHISCSGVVPLAGTWIEMF